MTPQIFTIQSSVGTAPYSSGNAIKVFTEWFEGKDTVSHLTRGLNLDVIKNQDANGNIKLPKGVWKFQLEFDMSPKTILGVKYVVYRPNLSIFLNNLPLTMRLPKYQYWGGIYPFSYPPIIFQVEINQDDTLFRIEIAPDYLENGSPKTDILLIGNVVFRGEKIAD
jgi:hypothetical protein